MNNNDFNDTFYKFTLNPFSYISYSVGSSTFLILSMLLIQVLMLFITKSFSSILIILLTISASLLAEFLYHKFQKDFYYKWLYAVFTGLVLGFLIPSNYPPLAVFLVAFICFSLCKFFFGGYTSSWINPVILSVVFLYLFNMDYFPPYMLNSGDFQNRNAALILIQNGSIPISKFDSSITAFLNRTIFDFFGILIPEGYVSFFWDTGSLIPAFRFNFLTLLSSLILFSFNVVDYLIPLLFMLVYSFLVKFISPIFLGSPSFQGDILLAILTSGTLFMTLFVLQWHGTLPLTLWGKIVYAVISGILAFFYLGFGTSSIGYVFTILIMNFISPIIQYIENIQVEYNVNNMILKRVNLLNEE